MSQTDLALSGSALTYWFMTLGRLPDLSEPSFLFGGFCIGFLLCQEGGDMKGSVLLEVPLGTFGQATVAAPWVTIVYLLNLKTGW